MRTTSSLESLNSQMNRSFAKHGHIWSFVEQLKFHEFAKTKEMKLIIKENKQVGRKRKNDREREKKIKFFSNLLKEGNISPSEFLEAMADRLIMPLNGNLVNKV